MIDQKIEILTDWVKGAFNRTGNRFNVNKSIEECYDIAKDYLDVVEAVSVDNLNSILRKAEDHYGVKEDLPSSKQIKEFIYVQDLTKKQEIFDKERYEKAYTKEQSDMMSEANLWITRGMIRSGVTDGVKRGLGLIISDIKHEPVRRSNLKWFEKVCGCQIQLFKEV